MANNELMNMNPEEIMSQIPATTLESFQASVFASKPNRLTLRSQREGITDTVMHAGNQLTSNMIVGHVLTIIRVAFASAPVTDNNHNPIYLHNDKGEVLMDKNGNPLRKMSTFPVCHFKETPGWWYNGGKMLTDNISVWADECGDDMTDPNFPKLNAELAEIGGVPAYFEWKDKKDGSGQRYVNMILG